mgnify:CR=1 FL=1
MCIRDRCRYVKSNAIVIANNKSTLGIGSGQPSRLDSCKIAIDKMHNFQRIKESDDSRGSSFNWIQRQIKRRKVVNETEGRHIYRP